MKEINLSNVFQTFGVIIAFTFTFWADHLISPIKGRSAGELSSEMADSVTSIFVAIIKDVFDQPYELHHTSYDVIWNLGLPFVLSLGSTVILGCVLFSLVKSFSLEVDGKLNIALKTLISLGLVFIASMSVIQVGKLLLLNFAVAATAILIFILVIAFFIAPFSNTDSTR